MQIVLPGALPDPQEARELTSYLPKTAPTLLRWLEQGRARTIAADPALAGCTPYEQWQLAARGFRPNDGQNLSAGLGPLLADPAITDGDPVWLVELVHVSPSRDGATLLPARELAITPEQSVALFESAQGLFADTGFSLSPSSVTQWRIALPPDFAPLGASPTMVSISAVNDWWPQDITARPWRRLVNEMQMLWFEHPVNQARYQHGLLPINSLWLFGGASRQQFHGNSHASLVPESVRAHDDLFAFSITRDWGGWLAALARLEADVFLPLAQGKAPDLVLTGTDRIVEITPSTMQRWTQWLPGSHQAWRKWWSPQN
jgi:hypothetical protein